MGGGGGEHLPSLADVSHSPGHISDRLLCCSCLQCNATTLYLHKILSDINNVNETLELSDTLEIQS